MGSKFIFCVKFMFQESVNLGEVFLHRFACRSVFWMPEDVWSVGESPGG